MDLFINEGFAEVSKCVLPTIMWTIKYKIEKSGYVFMILILIRYESVPYTLNLTQACCRPLETDGYLRRL